MTAPSPPARGIYAVVPVKQLNRSKSRLAGHLDDGARRAASMDMLRQVLGQLRQVPAVSAWAVLSSDQDAVSLARSLGGWAIADRGGGLNQALGAARDWAIGGNAAGLLVLPSDVPLVTSSDVEDMLRLGSESAASVVLAPSKDGGTNALLLRPPHVMPFRFGHGSAAIHRAEASRRHLVLAIYRSATLAFDVDTPEDFSCYLAVEEGLAQLDEAQALAIR